MADNRVLIFILLWVTSLPFIIESPLAIPIALFSTIAIAVILLNQNGYKFSVPRGALSLYALIATILILHGIFIGEFVMVMRTIIYVWIAFFGLILLPNSMKTVSIIQGLLVFSSTLAAVEIAGTIIENGYTSEMPIIGINLQPAGLIVTGNPNTFGILCAMAVFGYFANFRSISPPIFHLMGGVVFIGGVLSQSRSAWLSMVVVGVIVLVYQTFGQKAMFVTLFTSGIVAVSGFLSLLITRPEMLFNLTNRFILWEAAIKAIFHQPLGYGLQSAGEAIAPFVDVQEFAGKSSHNSYFRVLVSGGLIGGMAYLALMFTGLQYGVRITNRSQELAPLSFIIGSIVIQMFEAMAIFGISSKSILVAIAIGIVFQTVGDKNESNIGG